MDREAASCRQLASRARKSLKANRKKFVPDPELAKKLTATFQQAISDGDVTNLTNLLSENACFVSDGGGKVAAVPAPVRGAAKIAKMLVGFTKSFRNPEQLEVFDVLVNGLPGFVLRQNGRTIQTVALEINANDLIENIYVVRNPEKLQHLDRLNNGENWGTSD
ncbi:MAG: hypothetical protein AAF387_07055 [Pseudomonadota bacterium]